MRILSALLVGISVLPVALSHHRPQLGDRCKYKRTGYTECAIDRTHILVCDGKSWVKREYNLCDPGCCAKDHNGKHSPAYCLEGEEGNCLYRKDTSDDDDFGRSKLKRDLNDPRLRTDLHDFNTRCNPANSSESLKFNGTHYAVNGVCHEPFVCHDFDSKAGFTVCHHPNNSDPNMHLPLSVYPNVPQSTPLDDSYGGYLAKSRPQHREDHHEECHSYQDENGIKREWCDTYDSDTYDSDTADDDA
ncbi:hypothetical protein BDV96DRAFT_647074 [Lophiotrema nucula]|uniref:Uncharacterized protein n=1 Tax=Lophiotrema nucula TaxID=690887 RepID=A0A6A5Z5H1_9PLEO|nr:hypothetical protein BDV96DRAFT_647074 [Lophiotrema nucula]